MSDEAAQPWTLHPFLSAGDVPSSHMWYVVPTPKDDEKHAPGPRLGHGCCHCGGTHFLFFGGATPEGLSSDLYLLNIATGAWRKLAHTDAPGPSQRYDHGMCWMPGKHAVYVFGGVGEQGNLDDMWKLSLDTWSWSRIPTSGAAPSKRVVHNLVSSGSRLLVFGGGEQGMTAVDDRAVYTFDTESEEWERHAGTGSVPTRRQGHAMCSAEDGTVFLHGGLHDGTFHDDLYELNTDTMSWHRVDQRGERPQPRSGHGMCALGHTLIVTGGLGGGGSGGGAPTALDDVFVFHRDRKEWQRVELNTAPVAARFDFSLVPFKRALLEAGAEAASTQQDDQDDDNKDSDSERQAAPSSSPKTQPQQQKVAQKQAELDRGAEAGGRKEAVHAKDCDGQEKGGGVQDVTPMFGAVVGGKPEPLSATAPTAPPQQAPVMADARGVRASVARRAPAVTVAEADTVVMYGGVDLIGNMHNDCLFLHLSE